MSDDNVIQLRPANGADDADDCEAAFVNAIRKTSEQLAGLVEVQWRHREGYMASELARVHVSIMLDELTEALSALDMSLTDDTPPDSGTPIVETGT